MIFSVDFFRSQEKNNLSAIKSELDSRKERKRNLIPAKTGFIILFLSLFYTIIFGVGYKAFDDSGTRNYFLSLFSDFHTCIVAPGVQVFQAPSIQRKIYKILKTLKTPITIDNKVIPTSNTTQNIREEDQNITSSNDFGKTQKTSR